LKSTFTYSQNQTSWHSTTPERFLTTQHERDSETGYDYRGARYYDSEIARFLGVDVLADSFPAWSSYNYVMANPVRLIDPDGRLARIYEDRGSEGGETVNSEGRDFSLGLMYYHFQLGGKDVLNLNMSSIDFSHTSQSELGLTDLKVGDIVPVNLFVTGVNPISLSFGRAWFIYHGDNQFSMIDAFNFDPLWDEGASNARNIGNVSGLLINYNVHLLRLSPLTPFVPLIFGGPYDINFIGTTYIQT
jgi:RHS repeat-associated protein